MTKKLTLVLIVSFLFLVVIEGLSSLTLRTLQLIGLSTHKGSERVVTQWDPELGWINTPNAIEPNMFGPGKDVKINAQGIRADKEYSYQKKTDLPRILCSGDSFAFGFGVRNEDNWCAQLTVNQSQVESINMGQIGYGLDQAFLWYRRDGIRFEHNFHIMSVIFNDFLRMRQDRFEGFGKPTLGLEQGNLVVKNTPVPRLPYRLPWITRNWRLFEKFGFIEAAERIFWEFPRGQKVSMIEDDAMAPVTVAILKELTEINRKKKSRFILAFFPILADLEQDYSQGWKGFLKQQSEEIGFTFIDLLPAFKRLSPETVRSYYIAEGAIPYPGSAGHYTEAGNRFVAVQISKALSSPQKIHVTSFE